MRKVSASALVLIALLAVMGSAMSAFARSAVVDPFATHMAYPDLIVKGKSSPNFNGSPGQFRKAYGISSLPEKGAGVTVAIIDACGNPHAQADLNKYDSTFGLPSTTIKVVKPQGTTCSDPGGWGVETDLDIQMVHAVAPSAK